jgi:hypothetical protein
VVCFNTILFVAIFRDEQSRIDLPVRMIKHARLMLLIVSRLSYKGNFSFIKIDLVGGTGRLE